MSFEEIKVWMLGFEGVCVTYFLEVLVGLKLVCLYHF